MNEFEEYELNNMPSENEKAIFVINDLSSLNCAFRKTAALKKRVKEVSDLADKERFRINDWEQKELNKYRDNISYFESKIEDYHRTVLQQNSKEKTIKTPYGIVKSTRRKAAAEKVNELYIIDYAKKNRPDLLELEVNEKLDWSGLKKTLKVVEFGGEEMIIDENGVIVPGVAVVPEHITFKVEVDSNE